MKAWRKLGAFCHESGLTRTDFTDGARKPIPKTDGFTPWAAEDLARFRAHWPIGTAQREACELLQWTGARAVDVVTLGPGMIRDGLPDVPPGEDEDRRPCPVARTPLPDLEEDWRALAAALRTGQRMVFLLTAYGRPRSSKAFSRLVQRRSERLLALPDLSAHGLRKYRMNRLAEAGASVLQMQSWVGHVTLD
jgi:integrase/recombinase XerD